VSFDITEVKQDLTEIKVAVKNRAEDIVEALNLTFGAELTDMRCDATKAD
jgi:hypothetical protein